MTLPNSLRTRGCMWSGPVDLLIFSLVNFASTSCSLKLMSIIWCLMLLGLIPTKSPGGSAVNTLEKNDDRTSAFSCVVDVSTGDPFGGEFTMRCGISLLTLVLLLTKDQNFLGLALTLKAICLQDSRWNCLMRALDLFRARTYSLYFWPSFVSISLP